MHLYPQLTFKIERHHPVVDSVAVGLEQIPVFFACVVLFGLRVNQATKESPKHKQIKRFHLLKTDLIKSN